MGRPFNKLLNVENFIQPEPNTGCWLWLGKINRQGYGRFFIDWKEVQAHRACYEFYRGQIPHGLTLDHLCRNRWCVNPDHLEPVSFGVNVLRGIGVGAQNAKKTHCSKGHALTGHRGDGSRYCLTCNSDRARKRREKENVISKAEVRTIQ